MSENKTPDAVQEKRFIDVGTLAEILNLTDRRINQLVDAGLPREARGKYDLDACVRWYVRYLQKILEKRVIGMRDDGTPEDLAAVRFRRESAESELKVIELAEKREQLVAIEDVEKEISDLVVTAKARLLAIPARAAGELLGLTSRVQAQGIVDKHIREALALLEEKPAE